MGHEIEAMIETFREILFRVIGKKQWLLEYQDSVNSNGDGNLTGMHTGIISRQMKAFHVTKCAYFMVLKSEKIIEDVSYKIHISNY